MVVDVLAHAADLDKRSQIRHQQGYFPCTTTTATTTRNIVATFVSSSSTSTSTSSSRRRRRRRALFALTGTSPFFLLRPFFVRPVGTAGVGMV